RDDPSFQLAQFQGIHPSYGGLIQGSETPELLSLEFLEVPCNQPVFIWVVGSFDSGSPHYKNYAIAASASDVLGNTWQVDLDSTATGVPLYVISDTEPLPPPGESPFADVADDSRFLTEILWLVEQGITTGWTMPDETLEFRPGSPITREAMAVFLYRAAGSPPFEVPDYPSFRDVLATSGFLKQIEWLADTGISGGWTVGSEREFRPGNPITREAMASFLFQFAGSPEFKPPTTPSFADVPETSNFFLQIEWMAYHGISAGWGRGDGEFEFRPGASITREATAAFLFRASVLGGGLWEADR
ncbi:MAG: S-layer homology domain-containing protein, partial [Promicromonosporaceae bacterium]|nr:S-layer homology domain-containing protein [Promicromonosporaceae bacterium]